MDLKWPDSYIPEGFTPYHIEPSGIIYNCDCQDIVPHLPKVDIVLTDPPYNIKYHYNFYKDNLDEKEYAELIRQSIYKPCVIIHYPEDMHKISWILESIPMEVVSWIYNCNTPKQHRSIAWYGIKPCFSLIKQDYKNIKDKRIIRCIGDDKKPNIYDWWYINIVKNISKEKTDHPCQIPMEVIKNIITITPSILNIILDPFLGSGTTAVAAKELGRKFIGIEIEKKYCEIAVKRLRQGVLNYG